MSADANEICNPAQALRDFACQHPNKVAITTPSRTLTYGQFEEQTDTYAYTMQRAGISQGHKVVLMIKPSADLYTMALALLKIGAIPVVVDPGMGIARMLKSYHSVSPEAFVGITPAHIVRMFARKSFETIKSKIWVKDGSISFAGDKGPVHAPGTAFPIAPTKRHDLGIINFTTGSTGPAKAVEATYGMVMATVDLVRKDFHQTPDDVDMVTVPFFGIISLILGSSVVIPPMNPAKPAEVDPQKIIDTIHNYKVTCMLASPALLNRVGAYAKENNIKLLSLKFVNSGGASIDTHNLETFMSLLAPHAAMNSSWGATEGLPLATLPGKDLLGRYQPTIREGKGSPLGAILPNIDMRIITIDPNPIPNWSESLTAPTGSIGEIVVHGANVSRSYHKNAVANAAHKILETNEHETRIWHRTGDLAWQDARGVLHFTGRMAHSFRNTQGQLMHSVAAEGVTNSHPKVRRSALVGVSTRPIMCIELKEGVPASEQEPIRSELLALMKKSPATESVETVLFHRRFPVDLRHNAKIERPKLSIWAAHELLPKSKAAIFTKLVPIWGWLYLALGLIIDLPSGFWTVIWWIDLFLSVVVHIAQIPEGIRVGAFHGYTARESAVRTFVFGATWWKPLRPKV
ncbi:MAG: AMP-binding protein [Chitinophagaceae bacterium]|nr:AMP-binding protein [Oligoflexus sp.]